MSTLSPLTWTVTGSWRVGELAPVALAVAQRAAIALLAVGIVGITSEHEGRASSTNKSDTASDSIQRVGGSALVQMRDHHYCDSEPVRHTSQRREGSAEVVI
jgi:hypothetical protein